MTKGKTTKHAVGLFVDFHCSVLLAFFDNTAKEKVVPCMISSRNECRVQE